MKEVEPNSWSISSFYDNFFSSSIGWAGAKSWSAVLKELFETFL